MRMLFPGMKNMSVDEVRVWAKMGKENGDSPEKTLELITCIDDLLTIQQSAAMINKRRGNTRNRTKMKDVLIGRIMQMTE